MVMQARFNVGQVIRHRSCGYRGVVANVAPQFGGTEEDYETMASHWPPDASPWYYVLVDGAEYATFVSERNLEDDESGQPVRNRNLQRYFGDFRKGNYVSRRRLN